MKTKQIKKLQFALLFALGLGTHQLHAVTLNPGVTLALPGSTVAAEPQLAGTVIEDELIPFSFTSGIGSISGVVQQRVVQSSLDNTLDFYWRVMNDAASQDSVHFWRVGNFYAPEYNANWRIDGLGEVAPLSATRFENSLQSFVNFNFTTGIAPGEGSNFFYFDTTATHYNKSAFYDLASQGTFFASGAHDAFTSAVPAPSSTLMLTSGLAVLFAALRRRRTLRT